MGFWDYFKAIAVILAILFAAYFLTRLLAQYSTGFRKSSAIKLIGSLPLSKDKSVALIEVGDYAYILGVGGQRVERLDKIPAAELNIRNEEAAPKDFSENFKTELMSRLKKSVDS